MKYPVLALGVMLGFLQSGAVARTGSLQYGPLHTLAIDGALRIIVQTEPVDFGTHVTSCPVEGSQGPVGSGARDGLRDLPVIEVKSKESSSGILAVMVTGDGGWAEIDRDLAKGFSARGISVVGLDSLRYFWTRRTPEGAARDLEKILRHYLAAWHMREVIFIGYSRGADVLPPIMNRLPKELLDRVLLIALLGPSQRVEFEFHLTDLVKDSSRSDAIPLLPELTKLKGMKILCFCGEKETESLCKSLGEGLAKVFVFKGGHHFGGDYGAIADTIIKEASSLSGVGR